uniref:Enoyl reductase (ER) domain-containing protein n=1 Tax=Bionectria ochroleuca TaxID=29856 RepID=A0A8H7KBS4_BIOOC
MRSLATQKFGKPENYEILDLPQPEITRPDEILIKVHASSINPVDVKLATGMGKNLLPCPLPFKLGYDVSGTVVAVGKDVPSTLQPGAEVYSRVKEEYRGTASEFAISTVDATSPKPKSLTHIEAASLPLASLTALQVLDRADKQLVGGLKGKTVFIPAGLSGVGSTAIQLAKRVFQAGKVITTLSTSKIAQADGLLGADAIDIAIDYTKGNYATMIEEGSLDFMFDITNQSMGSLHLMKKGGLILTIAGAPFGDMLKVMTSLPTVVRYGLTAFGSWRQFKAGRYNVSFDYIPMHSSAEDLARLGQWVDQGKLRTVVGRVAKLRDVDAVLQGCQEVFSGKGGIGKFVIEVEQ